MNINVHFSVSSDSLNYFKYVRRNYIGLCSEPKKLRFHAYCLDEESYRHIRKDNLVFKVNALDYGRGSLGHAKSVNDAISKFVPAEINVISDTDIALLTNDWDLLLERLLLGVNSYGIVGVPYENVGGFSSDTGKTQTYKNIPTATWMAMSPEFDFSKLTVLPDKESVIHIDTLELAEVFQLPVGYQLLKDVGWQIPIYLHEHKIPYLALDIVKPTSPEAKVLRGCSPYHDEFQLDGQPLVAHQRGSMKHRFRIDPLSVDFYDACDRYLNNPSWAVFPTTGDRVSAFGQDVVNALKAPLRAIKRRLVK